MALKSVNSLLQSHGPGKSLCRGRHTSDNFGNLFVHVNDHFISGPTLDGPYEAHGFADAIHDLIGDFVGALGAFGEDVVDVRFVLENFFPAFAHWREIFPEFLEQLFLEIAVASSAFYESFAHVWRFHPSTRPASRA